MRFTCFSRTELVWPLVLCVFCVFFGVGLRVFSSVVGLSLSQNDVSSGCHLTPPPTLTHYVISLFSLRPKTDQTAQVWSMSGVEISQSPQPRTPLGELTALPQTLYLNYGGLLLRGVKGVGTGELRPPFLKFLDLPLYKEGDWVDS